MNGKLRGVMTVGVPVRGGGARPQGIKMGMETFIMRELVGRTDTMEKNVIGIAMWAVVTLVQSRLCFQM